jgi:hypothetical protein
MNFVIGWLITSIISLALSYFLTQSLADASEETIEEPDAWETPTVEEGTEIPVFFGVFWCESPNIVWWGDTEIGTYYYESDGT